jgi:hypothetical protein
MSVERTTFLLKLFWHLLAFIALTQNGQKPMGWSISVNLLKPHLPTYSLKSWFCGAFPKILVDVLHFLKHFFKNFFEGLPFLIVLSFSFVRLTLLVLGILFCTWSCIFDDANDVISIYFRAQWRPVPASQSTLFSKTESTGARWGPGPSPNPDQL